MSLTTEKQEVNKSFISWSLPYIRVLCLNLPPKSKLNCWLDIYFMRLSDLMRTLLALLLSLLVGASLGLLGGGGSILTVPILVYVLGKEEVVAMGYSLFIVGITSFVGAIRLQRLDLVDFRAALIFSPASMSTVFLVRKYLIPLFPDVIYQNGEIVVTKGIFLMLLLAVFMIIGGWRMLTNTTARTGQKVNYVLIFIIGMIVGLINGVLGAGGGFVIMPSLVVFAKLKMKVAVGTSLFIIAINSLTGFLGDLLNHTSMEWGLLLGLTFMATAGVFGGAELSRKIDGGRLKKGFAYFLFVMAILIIIKELYEV